MRPACLARLPEVHAGWMSSAEWENAGEIGTAVVVCSVLLAILLAPLLERAYSKRMQRFMSMREVAAAPVRWWRAGRRAPPSTAAETMPLAEAATLRERRVRIASAAGYAAFVVGGLASLVLQPPGNDRLLTAAYVVLLGIGPALVNVRPQMRAWWMWAPAVAMGALALALGRMDVGEAVVTVLAIVLVAVAGVHRTLRAVVGPATLVIGGAVAGLMVAVWAGEVLLPACAPSLIGETAGPLAQGLLFVAGTVLIVAGAAAGLALLPLARAAIERGWLSDLSLVSLFGAVFVAALPIAGADGPMRSPWLGLVLFAVWIGVTVLAYAAMLARLPCPATARTLLVLRVFSRDRRAERMLDALQNRWRYAGPVVEIGGPDLAALNIDLAEFIAFLTLRQHELLTPSSLSEAEFVGALDLAMDREGRFRIDEVFCFDSSWKTMVERLMRASDAILLDLRGFTPQRGGTTHEVLRLAALGLLPRVVTVTDAHTDAAHVAASMGGGSAAATVHAADADVAQQCWAALLAVADRATAQSIRTGSPREALA